MADDWASSLPPQLRGKVDECRAILRRLGRVAVAYSGGADSTFLLALAAETLGAANVLAATGISATYPAGERQAAREMAGRLGVELVEVETCELADPAFAANPPDRCFYCKSDLLMRLKELAGRRGIAAVVTGANADDRGDFRPGLEAGRQLGIIDPLMDAGLTKDDIRAASRAMGLPTWDKPSAACLASRIPYGQQITPEKLDRIDRAERVLRGLGFRQCRLRDHAPIARIEVPAAEVGRAAELRHRIVPALKDLGYAYVTLDLEGFRSGSMNETLPGEVRRPRPPAGS